jgi:hypothetical protein
VNADPMPVPPVIRLEVEYGDRRANAEVPVNATEAQVMHAAEWLRGLAEAWEVR